MGRGPSGMPLQTRASYHKCHANDNQFPFGISSKCHFSPPMKDTTLAKLWWAARHFSKLTICPVCPPSHQPIKYHGCLCYERPLLKCYTHISKFGLIQSYVVPLQWAVALNMTHCRNSDVCTPRMPYGFIALLLPLLWLWFMRVSRAVFSDDIA